MIKSSWTQLLALMLSCLLAAACSPLALAETASTTERTLTIAVLLGTSGVDQAMVDAFQVLHPDIEIRLTDAERNDSHAWYANELAADEGTIDLFWCWSNGADG